MVSPQKNWVESPWRYPDTWTRSQNFCCSQSLICRKILSIALLSAPPRGLASFYRREGERQGKRKRAGHDGKGEERSAPAFSLFPSSPARFLFFDFIVIPSGSLYGGESRNSTNPNRWENRFFFPTGLNHPHTNSTKHTEQQWAYFPCIYIFLVCSRLYVVRKHNWGRLICWKSIEIPEGIQFFLSEIAELLVAFQGGILAMF